METNQSEVFIESINDINQEQVKRRLLLEQKKAADAALRANRFGELFFPSLIYAFLFALCLYRNMSGIMMPIFSFGSFGYCLYIMKIWKIQMKKLSYFGGFIMVLLGISSCMTGNDAIQFFNFIGIFLILVFLLIHSVYDDSRWGFLKNVAALFVTGIEAIGSIADPFADLSAYSKTDKKKNHKTAMHVAIGILIAIPITVIAVLMLMSADIVFRGLSEGIFGNVDFGSVVGILMCYIIGFFLAYCGFSSLGKKCVKEEVKELRKHSAVIAITALSSISIIYVVFCYIQIAYLFIGGRVLPEGYTYSEYVHEGFYQLLFVCVMNLLIVLVTLGFFEKNRFLTALLLIISFCTSVMVASCAFRISMYVSVYGLSFLRILVYFTLAVVSTFLAGILIQIIKPDFKLFRYGFITFCILYLILAFIRPDYQIANYNLNILDEKYISSVDYEYLSRLSSDAAPVISKYMYEDGHSDISDLGYYAYRMQENKPESIRKYNFSGVKAYKLFSGH